jgi:hypothetical protein
VEINDKLRPNVEKCVRQRLGQMSGGAQNRFTVQVR